MKGVVHLPKVWTTRRGGKPYREAERSRGSTPAAGPSTAAPGSLSGLGPRTGLPPARPLRGDTGAFASLSEALIRAKATFSKKKMGFFKK